MSESSSTWKSGTGTEGGGGGGTSPGGVTTTGGGTEDQESVVKDKGEVVNETGTSQASDRTQVTVAMVPETVGKKRGEERSRKGLLERLYPEEGTAMPLVGQYFAKRPSKESFGKDGGTGRQKKLGLMLGVYLPSIQNVFGVIMFLRLCWMVGMMGVWEAFVMVFLCCLVTFLTTLSVSAIATNGVVESGGTYFMISRSLGPHLGVACGILFYLANAIAVAMYIVGGLEIFLNYMAPKAYLWGYEKEEDLVQIRLDAGLIGGVYANHVRLYGFILLAILFGIVAMGVRIVQWFAPFSLAGVIVGILAIYAGAIEKAVSVRSRPTVCVAQGLGGGFLLESKTCHLNFTQPTDATIDSADIRQCCTCNNCAARLRLGLNTTCLQGMTGFNGSIFAANSYKKYTDSDFSVYQRRSLNHPGKQIDLNKDTQLANELKDKGVVVNKQVTNFFAIMGIYFPSVTGILTGSNMSGDLADPQKSIPRGTLAAQLTTSFVYLSFVLIFGASIEPAVLLDKNGDSIANRMVIGELGWPTHWVVVIGCFLSTFGAGLQSLCSAPRLLASIAADKVIPFLAPMACKNCWNEPFIALLFTTAIAFVCLMIAVLDIVAPLVAMFFLQLYAYVNLACAVMTLIGAPGWRPRFKLYHWSLSLLGFFLSYFIMFSTYWYFAMITLFIGVIIAATVAWKGREMEWGDGLQGLSLSLARFFLSMLEGRQPHPKNWRPQFLLLHEGPADGIRRTLALIHQLKAGRGLVVVGNLLQTSHDPDPLNSTPDAPPQAPEPDPLLQLEKDLRTELDTAMVPGFVQSVHYRRGHLGSVLSCLFETAGLSALKPNTVLTLWPENWEQQEDDLWTFLDRVHRSTRRQLCLVIVRGIQTWPQQNEKKRGWMDVWWIIKDGGLLVLIGHLLRRHPVWARTKLRLFLVAEQHDQDADKVVKDEVEKLLYQLRIQATVSTVAAPGADTAAFHTPVDDEARERLAGLTNSEQRKVRAKDLQIVAETATLRVKNEKADSLRGILGSYLETDATQKPLCYDTETCTAARHLNQLIRSLSADADLLILNLPQPPQIATDMRNYMRYMDILLHRLPSVLLIRGTGKECITIYQ